MERDFLISIKPQYANLIMDGVKTIELRKKFPTEVKPGTKLIVYSSAPQSMIIGECYIESVTQYSIRNLWIAACSDAMISWVDFKNYFAGHKKGYAIKLSGYLRYEKPFRLSRFSFLPERPPQSYCYLEADRAKRLG